jgi:hypothetical protein
MDRFMFPSQSLAAPIAASASKAGFAPPTTPPPPPSSSSSLHCAPVCLCMVGDGDGECLSVDACSCACAYLGACMQIEDVCSLMHASNAQSRQARLCMLCIIEASLASCAVRGGGGR